MTTVSDNFTRADSNSLGANWTDPTNSIGIQSNKAYNTGVGGAIVYATWTNNIFTDAQFSEITIGNASIPAAGEWLGVLVRVKFSVDGDNNYLALYWNDGTAHPYVVNLYKTVNGVFQPLMVHSEANPDTSVTVVGQRNVGDKVRIEAVGSLISVSLNGTVLYSVTDTTITAGSPGIGFYLTDGRINGWSGGDSSSPLYIVDGDGCQQWAVSWLADAAHINNLRVLPPDTPDTSKDHNFLIILPVAGGYAESASYGNGLDTIRALNAHNTYNLTLVEVSTDLSGWIGDSSTDATIRLESFIVTQLVPWLRKSTLATRGIEKIWVIGFSRTGFANAFMVLKHPTIFDYVACWDFPAETMLSYNSYGANVYGDDTNFVANYKLSDTNISAWVTAGYPIHNNKIWIGGYNAFHTDVVDFDAQLTSHGIAHTLGPMNNVAHLWTSGWVAGALAGLNAMYQADYPSGPTPIPMIFDQHVPGGLFWWLTHNVFLGCTGPQSTAVGPTGATGPTGPGPQGKTGPTGPHP